MKMLMSRLTTTVNNYVKISKVIKTSAAMDERTENMIIIQASSTYQLLRARF
jgi:hypothetical protein